MKSSIFLLASIFPMIFIQGCNYGEETLKIVHPETVGLIENPDGSNAKKTLADYEDLGWFFVPQVILRPQEDKAWLALRIYRYGSELNYKIAHTEVFFPKEGIVGSAYSSSKEPSWYPAGGGWSYQVVRIKSYSYSKLMSSGINSASVEFNVISDIEGQRAVQNKTFGLEVKMVRRSGW